MKLVTRVLELVALLLFAGGLLGLWQIHHPSSAGEMLGIVGGHLAQNGSRIEALFLLVGWIGLRLHARHADHSPGPDPTGSKVHRIAGSTPAKESEGAVPERLAPASEQIERQRGRDLLRIRLEAFLRGEPDIAAFVDELLSAAVTHGASDVHLEVSREDAAIGWRRRGRLEELARVPITGHVAAIRRLKVLAGLPPYVSDRPQDGQIRVVIGDQPIAVRLATVPTAHGEKAALRFAGDARALPLPSLLPDAALRQRFESLLERPQGLVVLTGPTGSGKTTTLYSALDHLHRKRGERIRMASIEDPIEVDLPFVDQTQVDRARQLEFPQALRALLRQDPNVLMVGEIRDTETAKIAVQAGLSGHLILTTLHADSALGVFPRLIDLGVEPFLAASTTLASISQRLVRRLCPQCRHPSPPSSNLRRRIETALPALGPAIDIDRLATRLHTADGCEACEGRGFDDRRAVFELLELDSELRRAIAAGTSLPELDEMLRARGHRTLAMAALDLAEQGEIAIEEALGLLP